MTDATPRPETGGPAALRRKAEILLDRASKDLSALESSSNERLVHELQVHQIELELQNEELRSVYEEAAALRDKYRELYDFAPIGYFTLGAKSEILELNLRGAEMLGGRRAELIGRRFKDFLQPESLGNFTDFMSAATMGSDEESTTLLLSAIGRDTVYAKIQGRVFQEDGADIKVRLVMMDVTAVKFANDELQRSFEKFFTYWRP